MRKNPESDLRVSLTRSEPPSILGLFLHYNYYSNINSSHCVPAVLLFTFHFADYRVQSSP